MSVFFFFKQKTAYELRISDWSSDVCSSDLERVRSENVGECGIVDHPHRSVDQRGAARGIGFTPRPCQPLFGKVAAASGRSGGQPLEQSVKQRAPTRGIGRRRRERDRKSTRLNSSH